MVGASQDDYLWYVEQALDTMTSILRQLGDADANRRPALEGANSPYAIVTHCLGVMEYWGGHVVAARTIRRDRDAEFRAEGGVDELVERVTRARRQLRRDLSECEWAEPPRGTVAPDDAGLPLGRSQGGVLLHVLEELYQHLGQLELTRDVLLADRPAGHQG